MSQSQKTKGLSKLMTYILRHRPDEFGLVLDQDGFVPIKELIQAIHEEEGWSYVRMVDIMYVVNASDRERFQIDEKRIRACYGHSLPTKIQYEPSIPPKILYHGTRRKAYPNILNHGLRPMGRQYVHLTTSEDLALRIGRRRDPNPVLLTIDAQKAHKEGILFYSANELIYLVETLPVQYFTGPPLPDDKKAVETKKKKKQEEELEIPEYVLFARGLHPHKGQKKRKSKETSWKNETRKYRRQQKK